MNLIEYRREVITTTACPMENCKAEIDQQCQQVITCLSENHGLPVPHEHTIEVYYVHDDRSLAHLEQFHCASCDGHSCD